jgi:hypothetical protein
MSDEQLLKALGRRAREQREEKVDLTPIDDRKIASAILKPATAPAVAAPVRERSGRLLVFAFAAAAAIALFFLIPKKHDLPRYAFELSGNVAEVRAEGPKVVEQHATLHRDATLNIVLRPDTAVANVKATAVLKRNGQPQAWSPPMEISNDGAVRIVGPVKTVFPDTNGPWEIEITLTADNASRIVRAKIDFQ